MTIATLSIPAFFTFGSASVYSDIRHRKIPNRLILLGLVLAALGYMYLAANTLIGSHQIVFLTIGERYLPTSFYLRLLEHIALVIVSAMVLWRAGVWPAGDAKLFIVLSAMLPLADQNLRGFPTFLFLTALVNIFVAGGTYLSAIVMAEWSMKSVKFLRGDVVKEITAFVSKVRKRSLDEWPKRHKYLMLGWNTFALFLLIRSAQFSFLIPNSGMAVHLMTYALLYLGWPKVCRLFVRADVTGFCFLAVSAVIIPAEMFLRWDLFSMIMVSAKSTLGFWFFFNFIGGLIENYLRAARLETATVASLEPGIMLTDESWSELELKAGGHGVLNRYSDGLSVAEIAAVKERVTIRQKIQFYKSRPFALWVFAGCIWTLFIRENLAECCVRLLKSL